MRLSDLCVIQTGFTARSRFAAAEDGVPILQLGDVSPDGVIRAGELLRAQLSVPAEKHTVRLGDVVFRSRGERNTASAVDEHLQEPAVAVLPLMVLRPFRDVVIPEYLAWAINQPPAQRHFDAVARGTNIRMIPRAGLETLELDVPDLHTQRLIVTLDTLAQRERQLAELAADARRTMISLLLLERASGAGVHKNSSRNTR